MFCFDIANFNPYYVQQCRYFLHSLYCLVCYVLIYLLFRIIILQLNTYCKYVQLNSDVVFSFLAMAQKAKANVI